MTVKEVIDQLSKMPQDLKITVLNIDNRAGFEFDIVEISHDGKDKAYLIITIKERRYNRG